MHLWSMPLRSPLEVEHVWCNLYALLDLKRWPLDAKAKITVLHNGVLVQK